ncbi:hypothetical protein BGW39_000840 [Mortierella sp. 14UC]|nr:hypothetical protein BGW39_000840 [Mortierella sp. 14UC]
MRSSILLLVAAALVVVQAVPVTLEPQAPATPSGNVCHKVNGVLECVWVGPGPDPSLVEASATPSGRNVCHKVNGVLECVWVGPGPDPSLVEASAIPSGRRVCSKVNGVLECVWIGEPGPYSEDASPPLH